MKQAKKVLSVVLALAMVMAMGVMVFAANAYTPGATSTTTVEDGKIVITLAATGDNAGTFDYGVAFNPSKVTIAKGDIKFSDFVKDEYSMSERAVGENYAVATGVASGDLNPEAGTVLVTFTFTVKDGQTVGDGDLVVTTDTMKREISNDADGKPVVNQGTADASAPAPEVIPAPAEETAAPTAAPTEAATEAPVASTPADNTANTQTVAPAAATTAAPVATATATAAATTKTATPKTADTASVAIPVVAIVAAAAAVVAVSKKRVEE